jgi:hypothetical protein
MTHIYLGAEIERGQVALAAVGDTDHSLVISVWQCAQSLLPVVPKMA